MRSLNGEINHAIKKINNIRIDELGADLLHYTSQAALKAIIESEELHLSSLAFMNDPMEINYGIKFIKETLDALRDSSEQTSENGKLMCALFDSMILQADQMAMRYASVFVLSLTSKGERLIHWRTYGDDAKGVAISFDKEHLLNLPAADEDVRFMLVPVCYFARDRNDIAATIRQYFEEVADRKDFMDRVRNAVGSKMSVLARELLDELGLLPLVLKSEDYCEEHEWRLIAIVLSDRTASVEYPSEAAGSQKGPKLRVPLDVLSGVSDPPLEEVIVGPAINPMQFAVLLKESLLLKGRKNPAFIGSKIEYRPRHA